MYKGCIYCAVSPSTKKYYGQTSRNFEKRLNEHKYDSSKSTDGRFYGAIKKYGFDNFKWIIIETHDSYTKEELKFILNEREKYWIEKDNTISEDFGYNITMGGDGGDTLSNHPDIIKIKKKIGDFNRGKILSEETKKKIGDFNRGKILSEETRDKIGNIHRGKIPSEETKKKQSESIIGDKNHFYGKHHSKETIGKLSESMSGENHPQFGKKQSLETIDKRSKSLTGKLHKKIICEFCNKEIDDRNYHRWHGNNCKYKV